MYSKEEISNFIEYIEFERGLSGNTIKSYQRDLEVFFEYTDKNYDEIKKEDIDDYLKYLLSKYAKGTVARKISSLNVFFDFLFIENRIKSSPLDKIDSIKVAKRLPESLNLKELKEIVEAVPSTVKGERDRTLLKLLIATGCRISELTNLKIEDIDEYYSFIRVIGKGSKMRFVPIYEEMGRDLKDFIEFKRGSLEIKDENRYLVFGGVSRTLFWANLKKYGKNCGIKKSIYPHIFRHSLAVYMLKRGAGIKIVQEILGHANPSTTEGYTNISKTALKKAYAEIGIGDE